MTDALFTESLEPAFPTAEAGMRAVTEASDEWARQCVDDTIRKFAATYRPFSLNDIRDLFPEVRSSLPGARVNAAYKRGLIKPTGREVRSSLPSTHGKRLTEWVGA